MNRQESITIRNAAAPVEKNEQVASGGTRKLVAHRYFDKATAR